ncbi:penicillin acylase family protein, partial [Zavarzinia sp.]|uniref:penicillin acylase family protein n=1 Tax=Zavarzinia sp. TaxID=2027920 RepID=UPI003BB6E98E
APGGDAATALLGGRAGIGSNSFAVAGRRSESGAGLIASDPHLAIGLPNPVMVVGVKSPGFHVAGLMMPGLPFFPVGRNPDMAWGGTNLYAQTSDLFDAADLPIETISETFRVRGGRDRVLPLRRCMLGPIVSDGPLLRAKSPLALRWTGHGAGEEFTAMLAAARARAAGDFRAAIDGFGLPGLNITHAGRDGHIGHLRAVHVPRGRPRDPADLVLSPDAAWPLEGLATARELPAAHDPSSGAVVSANEPPPPGDIPIGHFFAPRDRAERISQLLAVRDTLSLDDLRRVQRDVSHAPALPLRDHLLALGTGTRRKPGARRLFDLIAGWDGSYAAESPGAAAFEVTLALLVRRVTGRHQLAAHEALRQSRRLIAEELRTLPRETLAPAFEKALGKAARRLPAGTVWGDLHRLRPGHFIAGLPRVGRFFRAPDRRSAGGNDTVAKAAFGLATGRHHVGFGAAVRHLSDLGDEDGNHFCLLGGQDGWFGSTTAMDQIDPWQAGETLQVPLRLETVRRSFTRVTVIEPL